MVRQKVVRVIMWIEDPSEAEAVRTIVLALAGVGVIQLHRITPVDDTMELLFDLLPPSGIANDAEWARESADELMSLDVAWSCVPAPRWPEDEHNSLTG